MIKEITNSSRKTGVYLIIYAFGSGILACAVSILIKLGFNLNLETHSYLIKLGLQGFLIGLAFLANSFMWILFSRSLALSKNTIYATGLNKFSNFISSALFGYLLFEERLNLVTWSSGIGCIFVGLVILADQQDKLVASENNNAEKSKVS